MLVHGKRISHLLHCPCAVLPLIEAMDPQARPLGNEAATVGSIFANLTSEMLSDLDISDRGLRDGVRDYSAVGALCALNQLVLRTPCAKEKVFE
jgi:hypothetical protein